MANRRSSPVSIRLSPESEAIVQRVMSDIPSMSRSAVINTALVGFYGGKPLTYYTVGTTTSTASPVAAVTYAASQVIEDPSDAPVATWPPPRRAYKRRED